MAIITFPGTLVAMRIDWGQKRYDLRFANGDSGAGQTRLLAPPRWMAAVSCPQFVKDAEAADWANTILSLNGQVNSLAMWNLGKPAPRGTMRGTMTLAAAVAVGDTTMSITAGVGQAGTTLLTGDFIGVGSGTTRQLVMLSADAVANGSGVIAVSFNPALRYAQSSASAVVWDKPTALFRQTVMESKWSHQAAVRSGYSLDLIESWE